MDSPHAARARAAWARRRARFGATGFSPDGLARLRAAAAHPSPDRHATHCRRGHPYTVANTYVYPDGKRRCRACVAAARAARRLRTQPSGLIRAGDSRRAAAARAAFARRRERFGPTGFSPDGLAHLRAAARPRQDRRTHCHRGHRYTVANTAWDPRTRRRRCRACLLLARHRARWAQHCAAKRAALKAAMLRAHPDRGGTEPRFIAARRRYLAALGRPADDARTR